MISNHMIVERQEKAWSKKRLLEVLDRLDLVKLQRCTLYRLSREEKVNMDADFILEVRMSANNRYTVLC